MFSSRHVTAYAADRRRGITGGGGGGHADGSHTVEALMRAPLVFVAGWRDAQRGQVEPIQKSTNPKQVSDLNRLPSARMLKRSTRRSRRQR